MPLALKAGQGGGSSRRRWKDGGPGVGGEVPSVTGNRGVSNKPRPLTWGHSGKWEQTTKDHEPEADALSPPLTKAGIPAASGAGRRPVRAPACLQSGPRACQAADTGRRRSGRDLLICFVWAFFTNMESGAESPAVTRGLH